jgi:hypothetical protein
MPVLTAAGYNNPVAPSIDPLAAPPDAYQNLRADVGSFGGATAQALSGLGTSLERAATNFAAIESEHAKVTALEARTNAERASNNILYGNPEDSTSVGFFGLEGRTKLAARPEVIKQLNAVYDEAGRGLTPEAKRLFDAASRSHRVGVEASVAHDAVKALAQYREQTDKGDIVLAGQNTDRLALSDDLGAWNASVGEGVAKIAAAGQRANKPPELIEAEQNAFRSGRLIEKASALAERNPQAAMELLDNNRKFFADPSTFEAIYGKAKEKAEARQVDQLAAPSGSTQAGAGTLSVPEMVALAERAGFKGEAARTIAAIARSESGGDPNAHNPRYPDDSYGITQINALAHGEKAKAAKGNPLRAMELAFEISKGGTDFSPWTEYKNKGYQKYLGEATRGPTTAQGEPPKINYVGDSLSAHPIRRKLGGGQESGKVGVYNEGDTAVAGWNSQRILNELIPKLPEAVVKGQVVSLSTGISNAANADEVQQSLTETIPAQIATLRERGAKNIVLMGVGTDPKLAGVNEALAKIAAENKDVGVVFAGPQRKTGGDRIHSSDQGAEVKAVQEALGQSAPPTTTQGAPSLASEHTRIDASGASQEVKDKAKARVNARYSQQTAIWEQNEDGLRRRIRDGDASVTEPFLDAEMDAGRLGPSQRQQLEAYRHGVVKERATLSDALALVAEVKNGNGTLDPTNAHHKKAVELDFANTSQGWKPEEQWQRSLDYIGKVSVVPDRVKTTVTGNLFSGNETQATTGARQYRDLVALNPMLGEGFNADARAMAATLNTMAGFGMVPKEAFTQAQAQMRVPQAEQEARKKAFDSVRGESERDRLANDTKAITSRHNSLFGGWRGLDPGTIPDAMLFDFREASQTFYARTGNLDAAYQAAYDTMAIKWAPSQVGADGLRWTKGAPESFIRHRGAPITRIGRTNNS